MRDTERELERIADEGGVADLSFVLANLNAYGSSRGGASVRAVRGILERADGEAILRLAGRSDWADGYRAFCALWIDAAAVRLQPAPIQALLTLHSSGYVREAAVVELAARSDPRELPFLLLRTNDWVPAVAQRARLAVEARVVPGWACAWTLALPIVDHLRGVGRNDLRSLAAAIDALVAADDEALREGLDSASSRTRRLSVRLVSSMSGERAVRLLMHAAQGRDPAVSSQAVFRLSSMLDEDALRSAAERWRRSPIADVRRRGLETLCARWPDTSGPALRDALLDRNGTVRAIARFELKKRGEDVRRVLRETLDGVRGRAAVPTIVGLADCEVPEDADAIAPFARDRNAATRLAALRALARLAPERHAAVFLAARSDPSRRVAREVAVFLARYPWFAR